MEYHKTMTPKTLSLTHLVQAPWQSRVGGPEAETTGPPLLVLLHGVGSNEHDLIGLAPHLDGRFLVVSARSPLTLGPGAFGWYPVHFTPQGAVGDTNKAREGRDLLEKFVRELPGAYGTDPKRTYLLGFSQGAIMSLYLTLTRPELVTGVVAMSGRLLPQAKEERAPDERLRGLHVLAVHGTRDPVLPVAGGREIRDELLKLPVSINYKEYDMAHEVSAESLADTAEWLTQQLDDGD